MSMSSRSVSSSRSMRATIDLWSWTIGAAASANPTSRDHSGYSTSSSARACGTRVPRRKSRIRSTTASRSSGDSPRHLAGGLADVLDVREQLRVLRAEGVGGTHCSRSLLS